MNRIDRDLPLALRLTLLHMPSIWILFFSFLYVLLPSITQNFLFLLMPAFISDHARNIHQFSFLLIVFGLLVSLQIDKRTLRALNSRIHNCRSYFHCATDKPSQASIFFSISITLIVAVLVILLWIRMDSNLSRSAALIVYEEFVVNTKFIYFVIILQWTCAYFYIKYGKTIFLLPFLLIFVADAAHGGRSLSLASLILIWLLLYLRIPIIFTVKNIAMGIMLVLLIIAAPVITRFTEQAESLSVLYARLTSELYLSYWGAASLIESGEVSSNPLTGIVSQFITALTFVNFNDAATNDHQWYKFAEYYADSGFGLAANVAAEAVYYYGTDYYGVILFLGPIMVSALILMLSQVFAKFHLLFLLALIFVLVSTIQGLSRLGFIVGITEMLRIIMICLGVFTIYGFVTLVIRRVR